MFVLNKTKPKILIVDDNPVCRKQTEATAQKNCECVCVNCGEDAVTAFVDTFKNQERKFDAILLDFEMPTMNGLAVIAEIRKSEQKLQISKEEQVKIIMATSHNDRQVINACKTMGCNHYILQSTFTTGDHAPVNLS